VYRTAPTRPTRVFKNIWFSIFDGRLQASPDSIAASHFSFIPFIMLEQFKELAREDKEVVLSLVILRDRLYYGYVYV
jgi:hypothetical protein